MTSTPVYRYSIQGCQLRYHGYHPMMMSSNASYLSPSCGIQGCFQCHPVVSWVHIIYHDISSNIRFAMVRDWHLINIRGYHIFMISRNAKYSMLPPLYSMSVGYDILQCQQWHLLMSCYSIQGDISYKSIQGDICLAI